MLALAGAAAWFQPEVSGDDLWWLLAAGREIVRSGGVPTVDPFSFTFAGRPWTHHEWLWSLVAWLAYRTHPALLAWLNFVLLLVVFALVAGLARIESRSWPASIVATWAAAATAHFFLDVRPHLVSLALVLLLLVTRSRPWAPWLWPPLTLLWVNLHGGFLLGLCIVAALVALAALEAGLRQRRLVLPARPCIGLGLSLGAALVNPWGWRIVEYPLAYLEGSSLFRSISEWLPPPFGLDPATFQGRFWWLVPLSALGLPRAVATARPLVLLWGVTLAMATTSRRFIPLFAVVAAPLVALAIGWLLDRARSGRMWDAPAARLVASAIALAVVIALWHDVRLAPRLLERSTLSALAPRAALSYLGVLGAPRRPFHEFNWGGFILLHAPGIPVFIDGRANTLYDAALARDYLQLDSAGDGFEEVLARWRIDAAIVPAYHPLVRALRRGAAPWRLVYRDAIAAILLAPDSPLLRDPLPEPDATTPEALTFEAQRHLRQDHPEPARAAAARAVERDPLFFLAYRELALAYAGAGDEQGMRRALEQGREAYPRGWRRFRAFEGLGWERLGRPDLALPAYRDALPRGPFGTEPAVEARIRDLETGVAREAR